ncbi:MAG: 3-deoxy-manno-octulosonate cytidylyltransferase [Burkholderiaceae bacterium]|nr:3-deoxy-manno-octulosonate cytidylyltransferase [Burkholderiaceae bacterium]
MDFWAVIPARRASTRLPDKPLADIGGQPMVVRVAQQASRSGASRVIVATDDQEILQACLQGGFEALLTRADHPSGTDRIAEVAQRVGATTDQCIVNVQGDEPLISPLLIRDVALTLAQAPTASVATAATPIRDTHSLRSPHVVKVVCDESGLARYFSRAPIPYLRGAWAQLEDVALPDDHPAFNPLRHIGIYAFRARALSQFVTWSSCPPEDSEQLEQLRWLWKGHHIAVCMTNAAPHAGVDTPEDLDRVRRLWTEHNPGT